MSQGSAVAALDGDAAPPASRPARAKVTAAAMASSALLAGRSRGLTIIVDSALSFPESAVVPWRLPPRTRPFAVSGPRPTPGLPPAPGVGADTPVYGSGKAGRSF